MFKRIRKALDLGAIGVNVDIDGEGDEFSFRITFTGPTPESTKRLSTHYFCVRQDHMKRYAFDGLMTYVRELDSSETEEVADILDDSGYSLEGLVKLPSDYVYYYDINNEIVLVERTENTEASMMRLLIVKKAEEVQKRIRESNKTKRAETKAKESARKKLGQADARRCALLEKLEYLASLKPKDEASKKFITQEKAKLQKKIDNLDTKIATLQTPAV